MDFQQGLIATIHDYGLGKLDLPDFRRQMRQRPTSLLIPCLMEEFSRPALGLIREVLAELSGLEELVIALSAETSDDVAAADGDTLALLGGGEVVVGDRVAALELVDSVELFRALSPEHKATIADALKCEVFDEGDVVITEGETGDRLYVVSSGKFIFIFLIKGISDLKTCLDYSYHHARSREKFPCLFV